jgi:hypothetical protein
MDWLGGMLLALQKHARDFNADELFEQREWSWPRWWLDL